MKKNSNLIKLVKKEIIKALGKNAYEVKNVFAMNNSLIKLASANIEGINYNCEYETRFYNRGVICEMLTRVLVYQLCDGVIDTEERKHNANESDLNTTICNLNKLNKYGLPYDSDLEIKMSYPSGLASGIKNPNVKNILLFTPKGFMLVKREDIQYTKNNKIDYKQPKGVWLKELNKVIGL